MGYPAIRIFAILEAMITGFISDIHEDIQSLNKAIRLLERRGANELICLGDVAGFSGRYYSFTRTRSARKCWETVLQECVEVIPGNHDLFAIRKAPDLFKGLGLPENWYELPLEDRERIAGKQVWLYEPEEDANDLTEALARIIAELPVWKTIQRGNLTVLLSHFVFPDLTGSGTTFLPHPDFIRSHLQFMQQHQAGVGFFGHQHQEGLGEIHKGGTSHDRFRRNTPLIKNVAYSMPAVAHGRNRSGVCLADWHNQSIKALPLSFWM